jgi:3-deoxy-D-manno-octulosonic-acid transferase
VNHFDVAYTMAAPFVLGAAAYKRLRHGKYRRSLPGMFGANLPKPPLPPHRERVWLHSVSVGETVAAGAVFKLLKERFPAWEFLSTTTTETGQDQAKRSLASANMHDFAPADFGWNVRRFLSAYNPSIYLFFETEIWPNVLLNCRRRGMPIFLVNGKLSDRSARGYARLGPILRGPLSAVQVFFMQTEDDARRLRMVVGNGPEIQVTGNVKFDGLPNPLTPEDRQALRAKWGVPNDAFLVLAGSTHPREEALIARAFKALNNQFPGARLVIAPRHPERFSSVEEELRALGFTVHRTSTGSPSTQPTELILLDEMGVLARSFGAADVAMVGGAWNPIGGHNLLEPAAHGVPVIHGPHMHAQKEIMRLLNASQGSLTVSEEQLADALINLASHPERRRELGERGQRTAQQNRGAAHRVVEAIAEKLYPKNTSESHGEA